MKKILLSSLCAFFAATGAYAQGVTYLMENFDATCTVSTNRPDHWVIYNPLPATMPQGEWTCAPEQGRGGTNGMMCTGTYGAMYHLDTSYFITPALNLSSFHKVFLHFDAKATNIHLGGRLTVVKVDTGFVTSGTPIPSASDTTSLFPIISSGDSSVWVRHQVDLTPYISSIPIYIAFRYTSVSTSGTVWYLDNVNTDTTDATKLGIHEINMTQMPLTVIGSATSGQVTFSYTVGATGIYNIALYDIMGREVYKKQLYATVGTATNTIGDLSLRPGMYLIKMGNESSYGTTKVIVQ